MKTITLLIGDYESEPVEISITPDMTALQILTQVGLEECTLARVEEPMNFLLEEAVYDKVLDGEMLYAFFPPGE
jgi:hypothetical protein